MPLNALILVSGSFQTILPPLHVAAADASIVVDAHFPDDVGAADADQAHRRTYRAPRRSVIPTLIAVAVFIGGTPPFLRRLQP